MNGLLSEPIKQTNGKVFKTSHVAFSLVTGTGRYVTGLKQFRDANPELCREVSEQKAWAIHPSVIQVTPGFNSREMGMGEDFYKLPEMQVHIQNIKNAYIRGDYVDPIRVRIFDGVPFVRQGHCRLIAAMQACNEGHDITILCVEIKEDEIGCELATLDGNRGMALSPVAYGESYRRLHSLAGWSLERIAQRENKSPTTISSLIRLTSCSVVIKKWIHADAISYVNVLSLIDEYGEAEAISRIKKMISDLQQADANGIVVKKTPQGQVRVRPSDFKQARIPPVIATKAVEGVKLITTSLLQKLGDIELPEITDSSADEEIPITLNRSTLEMLKALSKEIIDSENKQIRRAENRQARLNGEQTKYARKPKGKTADEIDESASDHSSAHE